MLLLLATLPGLASAATNVFEYPLVFRKHQQLTIDFQRAMREKNLPDMERACRTGLALLPEDAVWRYNLACALTLQNRLDDALAALQQSIHDGFRNDLQIGADHDLARLHPLPAFSNLLAQARALRGIPVAGRPRITPAPVVNGLATVSTANTHWDMDRGHFQSFFALPTNTLPATTASLAAQWHGPAAAHLRPWLTLGTAAGNAGDFYDNRDDGHSRLDLTPFSGASAIVYSEEARLYHAHYGLNTFIYNGIVVGNSSVAITAGPYWRSVPRSALTEGAAVALLTEQYLSNQLYCYPSHRDHDAQGLGDLYPVNQPYVVITQGSSGTDQPFLQALFATLAAFRPETKRFLAARGQIAPTLQMLLRSSSKLVATPDDYLSGKAHPTVFDAANLDVDRLVTLAHALTTNDIPPLVSLRTLADQRAVAGVDFFDGANAEALYDSPCAISRVLRNTAQRHAITLSAQLTGVPAPGWHLRWVVLRGDPRKVVLRPLRPDQSQMEVTVTHHGGRFPVRTGEPLQTSRVDIGVFATDGQRASAPSFLSFVHLNNEIRTYADDGRILVMDYASAATNRYVDPMLSLAKRWRDEYQYDADQKPTGWIRHTSGQIERFNTRGERIEQTDSQGRPTVTRTVNYLPRLSAENTTPPDWIQVEGDYRINYRYASAQDRTGTVASRERVSP